MACRVPSFRYGIKLIWSGGNPPTAKENTNNGVKGGKIYKTDVIYPRRVPHPWMASAATAPQVCDVQTLGY